MNFTSLVSPAEYREALRLKGRNRRRIIYAILFCDFAAWIYWAALAGEGKISKASAVMAQAIIFLIWPLIYILALEASGLFGYRRNRNIRREISFHVTPEGFSYTSSSGSAASSPWTSLNYWRESKNTFILVFPSNVFLIVSKSALSAEQQEELRTIFSGALPKR